MSMNNTNTHGFSVIELVILLIIIAILAALGLLLYEQTHKTVQSTNSATSKQTNSDASSSTTLAIKEWGVQFKLTNTAVTDAYYTAPSIDSASGLERIGLGTKATNVELECADGSKTQQTTFEYINRSTDKDKVVTAVSSAAKQVGNYYYSIEFGGGAGCSPVSTNGPFASAVSKEFEQNFVSGNLVLE